MDSRREIDRIDYEKNDVMDVSRSMSSNPLKVKDPRHSVFTLHSSIRGDRTTYRSITYLYVCMYHWHDVSYQYSPLRDCGKKGCENVRMPICRDGEKGK